MEGKNTRVASAASHVVRNEPLIFERSRAGRRGYRLPALDVPNEELGSLLPADAVRDDIPGLPEVSEVEHLAAAEHRFGERVRLATVEAPKKAGHEEGRHLIVGHVPRGVSVGQGAELARLDAPAVTLPLDQPEREH